MGSWLVPAGPITDSVLVCLPQAGAGCGQFGSWSARLSPHTTVVGVQLPGRERRWADPPVEEFDEAVAAIAAELVALVGSAGVTIYGHSFGGLLGYALAGALGRQGHWPGSLVVAACRPPAMWVGAGRALVDDPDELAALLVRRGLGPDVLDEETWDYSMGVLRHDARLSMSFRLEAAQVWPVPLHAWGGDGDETVSTADLDGWHAYTSAGFHRRQFPGGHAFHSVHPEAVVDALRPLLPLGGRSCTSI